MPSEDGRSVGCGRRRWRRLLGRFRDSPEVPNAAEAGGRRVRRAEAAWAGRAFACGLVLAVAVVLVAAFGAGPAGAHSHLVAAYPAPGSAVASAPSELRLEFEEPVTVSEEPVAVEGPSGPVSTGTATMGLGQRSLTVPLGQSSGDGVYSVRWQVTADDGDVASGTYEFSVGTGRKALPASPAQEAPGAWQSALLRALLLASLAMAVGEQAGSVLYRGRPGLLGPVPIGAWACAGGAFAAAGSAVLLAGGGSISAGLFHPQLGAVAASPPGRVVLAQAAAFALGAVALQLKGAAAAPERQRARWSWSGASAWLALGAVVSAEAFRSHLQEVRPGLGFVLAVAHVACGTLWVGMLVHALRTARANRRTAGAMWAAVAAYSKAAVWLLVLVLNSGAAAAVLLVPSAALLATGYGLALMGKAGLVAVATVLAWAASRLLKRRAEAGRLHRPARAEAAVLGLVLGFSALLTALPPPALG